MTEKEQHPDAFEIHDEATHLPGGWRYFRRYYSASRAAFVAKERSVFFARRVRVTDTSTGDFIIYSSKGHAEV